MLKFFPEYEKYCQVLVSKEAIKNLQDIFRRLGYEVEEANYAGEWKWFRVHCKPEEVKSNVERLTEALRGFDRRKISAG